MPSSLRLLAAAPRPMRVIAPGPATESQPCLTCVPSHPNPEVAGPGAVDTGDRDRNLLP
jgi:hypothetical protein